MMHAAWAKPELPRHEQSLTRGIPDASGPSSRQSQQHVGDVGVGLDDIVVLFFSSMSVPLVFGVHNAAYNILSVARSGSGHCVVRRRAWWNENSLKNKMAACLSRTRHPFTLQLYLLYDAPRKSSDRELHVCKLLANRTPFRGGCGWQHHTITTTIIFSAA